MNIDLVTKEEFYNLKTELLQELRSYLRPEPQIHVLKSSEVKQLLNCSDSTLQKHRISGRLAFKKVGGTYYYQRKDIDNLLTATNTTVMKFHV